MSAVRVLALMPEPMLIRPSIPGLIPTGRIAAWQSWTRAWRLRLGNAERVARATPETDPMHDLARDRARQIGVMIDEIAAGLHHGEAAAQAAHTGFAAGSAGE